MKFLFKSEAFSFETLRVAGYANYCGSDLGEVLVTAQAIKDGNEDDWLNAWEATGNRVAAIAKMCMKQGHRVSASEAFLRASNYYRTAEFFRRDDPVNDYRAAKISRLSRECFVEGAKMLGTPFEIISIPYEGTTLPGYLFLVDDSGKRRPTIIYNSGFDSTQEESYFVIAAAALRRGYNVLAFDGPGQGAALRLQGLVFRHDWEKVITPVIDYALTRKEIAPKSIALFGYSLGGFLVARAAAFDNRPAALLLDDGIYDFHAAFRDKMPPILLKWIYAEKYHRVYPFLKLRMSIDGSARWGANNGKWNFGAASAMEFLNKTRKYTLEGIVDKIQAPTLILDAENDHFLKGQPEILYAALKCKKHLIKLTSAEGAGEHCHVGAMGRMHQVVFDWLNETLARLPGVDKESEQ
jgi:pimeloyl-ACP methyl ester carboxylesterase